MDYFAYQPGAWQTFYAAIAAASATLTGLLFVGMSLNLRTILKIPSYRARARETFGVLLSLLVLALFVLIPGQAPSVLGWELSLSGLILAVFTVRLQGQTLTRLVPGQRIHWASRLVALNLGALLILFAGISLILQRFGGLFWLVPTVLIYLLWALNNAWLLVVQVAEEQP